MAEDYNKTQIVRKDARNCFVESLNDSFGIGKVHFNFATYDLNKPKGQRQTNNIGIYLAVDEFLELCRKLECGELKFIAGNKKKNGDSTPIYQSLGGTSADRLKAMGRARSDGKSLSRTMQLTCGNNGFLLIADSGLGETDSRGLIVPKFGNKPENHVVVSMTFEVLSELLLITKAHYNAWLCAFYMSQPTAAKGSSKPTQNQTSASDIDPNELF